MDVSKVTGQQSGVTRDYLESLERTFSILTFFIFISSMSCGGCVAYGINAKCCKQGKTGKGGEVNMGGMRREANTLEMQVVETESPGVSPASNKSRTKGLQHQRSDTNVRFNLNLKKTGSLESD